jgi:hypothetical protein
MCGVDNAQGRTSSKTDNWRAGCKHETSMKDVKAGGEPQRALISTCAGDRNPGAALPAQLAGRQVLRTDVNRTIRAETDCRSAL